MLDTLRANSRSVLTYVLFGIIIVVFVVSFGPGSKGCGATGGRAESWAAKVNGETVTPAEFEQQYGQLAKLYGQQIGNDPSGMLQLRLRQMAMDQVIQRQLIEQEARKKGIVVTDDEVSSAIKEIPSFQTNGRFDMELYKRVVASYYGSPGKFEETMRRDLSYQKMVTLIRNTVKVTEDEVKDAWLAENDLADLEVARFSLVAARLAVVPTDAQVQEAMKRDTARIEQFYKDNPARFDRKKRVRARHILVRVDEKAPAAEQEQAKKRIEAIAERLKKGEDFSKVASEVSEDPGSKSRGGDLGFFGAGVMAKDFESAAFALKPGELSNPVKTPFGWHLIKVEEVQEPEIVSLEKARPEIARELVAEDLGRKLATDKAIEALKKLQAGRTFAEVFPAEPKGKQEVVKVGAQVVKPETTGPFSASSAPNIPKIGPAPELFADAMKANAGQVLAKVYETPSGPIVARVKDRQRADASKYAEHRGEVESRLRLRRESDLERAWVEDLRKRSKVEANQPFVLGSARAPNVELD